MRALTAALLFFPTIAIGQFYRGNEIVNVCESPASIAYAIGVLDTVLTLQAYDEEKTLCLPDHVTTGQVRDVMCAYLRESPDKQHQAAASMAWYAFEEAWPCTP